MKGYGIVNMIKKIAELDWLMLLKAAFNGIAQVVFINNWKYGVIVFLAITSINISCGLAIFFASLITNIISSFFMKEEVIESGLASFNNVILFLILYAIFGGISNFLLILPFSLLCIVLEVVITKMLHKFSLPALALPAVFSVYILYGIDYILPNVLFTQSSFTAISAMTQTLGAGIINHFISNVGAVYLQTNAIFSLVLIIAFVVVQREYLIYICSSFIFTYLIYWLLSFVIAVDVATFPTFNILLGLMCAKVFGFLPLDNKLLFKIAAMTIAVTLLEILINWLFTPIGLPGLTIPFILVILVMCAWTNYQAKMKLEK